MQHALRIASGLANNGQATHVVQKVAKYAQVNRECIKRDMSFCISTRANSSLLSYSLGKFYSLQEGWQATCVRVQQDDCRIMYGNNLALLWAYVINRRKESPNLAKICPEIETHQQVCEAEVIRTELPTRDLLVCPCVQCFQTLMKFRNAIYVQVGG
jgi:hypothetical protein